MSLSEEIGRIVESWARDSGCGVERTSWGWLVRPEADLDGGTIGVVLRANEHGPIEVSPSNDEGWFDRFGCHPAFLRGFLDASLQQLHEWVGRGDPYQGLP